MSTALLVDITSASSIMVTGLIHRWFLEDDGQDLVEYVLLGSTVAFAGVAVMAVFDDTIRVVYQSWDASTQAIWEPQDPQP